MAQRHYDHSDMDNLFGYHPPNQQQAEVHDQLRQRAKDMFDTLMEATPGDLRDAAVIAISDALMACNRVVAVEGLDIL